MRKNRKSSVDKLQPTVVSLTSRGVKGWAICILMIAGWMFALGVFVGRGTTPVKFDIDLMQQELAVLRESLASRKKDEKPVLRGEPDIATSLEFPRKLKDSTPETAFQEDLRRIEKQPDPPPVPPPALAALNPPDPATPIPAPPAPAESNTLPARMPTAGDWTIQVAAVKDAGDADRMVETLRKKGYDAYRVSARVEPDDTWHRVRVGAFSDREQAGKTLERLHGDAFKGFVVKR